jgi:hypothetical protein
MEKLIGLDFEQRPGIILNANHSIMRQEALYCARRWKS